MRSYRLLRLIAEPARDEAPSRDGHPVIASFEPGERWFYDYRTEKVFAGPSLAPPRWHPDDQPVPGPAGRVPPDWESLLHE